MTAEIVRIPREHVFRIDKRFAICEEGEAGEKRTRSLILDEMRRVNEALRILKLRQAALLHQFWKSLGGPLSRTKRVREVMALLDDRSEEEILSLTGIDPGA
jgi:hypothetical protein